MASRSTMESPQEAEIGGELIADFDQGSCGTRFHKGVHFVNLDGKRMRIWYLGAHRYRVVGQTRVVTNPPGAVSEAPGEIAQDQVFSLKELF